MSPSKKPPAGSLQLTGDPGDPTPLYFRLRNVLRESIESLEYPSGSQLPSERDMARLYGVSRITVRQALDAIAREGLVRRSRGRKGGTFVQSRGQRPDSPKVVGAFNELLSAREVRKIEIDAFDVRVCDAEIGRTLYLPPQTSVRYIERRFLGALAHVAFVRNFLPISVGKRLHRRELSATTLYRALTQRLGVKIAEVRDEVEAVLADTRIAPRLGVRVGTAMLSIRRIYFTPGDEPVNLTILMTRSNLYTMSVRLQDHGFE
jgi:GntR family transcriptional regulator